MSFLLLLLEGERRQPVPLEMSLWFENRSNNLDWVDIEKNCLEEHRRFTNFVFAVFFDIFFLNWLSHLEICLLICVLIFFNFPCQKKFMYHIAKRFYTESIKAYNSWIVWKNWNIVLILGFGLIPSAPELCWPQCVVQIMTNFKINNFYANTVSMQNFATHSHLSVKIKGKV